MTIRAHFDVLDDVPGATRPGSNAEQHACRRQSLNSNEAMDHELARHRTLRFRAVSLLIAAVTLVACGGGGDGSPAIPAPSGGKGTTGSSEPFVCTPPPEVALTAVTAAAVAAGQIEGSANPSYVLMRLPGTDGLVIDRFLVYGPDLGASSDIRGVVLAGEGYVCSSPDPASYNGSDYGPSGSRVFLYEGPSADVIGLGGSLRYPTATYPLVPTSLPGAPAGYVHGALQLADIAGSWSMANTAGVSVQLSMDAGGTFQFQEGTCQFSGAIVAEPGGVFRLSGNVGSSCVVAGGHLDGFFITGAVTAYPLATGGQQLIAVILAHNYFDSTLFAAAGRR